jgi:hypothetical protein
MRSPGGRSRAASARGRAGCLGAAEVDDDVVALLEAAHDALMSSPFGPCTRSKTMSRSASRTRWMSTCLAVCAAMRPKVLRACFSLSRSPNSLSCSRALLGVFGAPEHLEAQLLAELRVERAPLTCRARSVARGLRRPRPRSCTGRDRPGRCHRCSEPRALGSDRRRSALLCGWPPRWSRRVLVLLVPDVRAPSLWAVARSGRFFVFASPWMTGRRGSFEPALRAFGAGAGRAR